MYLEISPPDMLDFPFSNRWIDLFGLGVQPAMVLRPDGVWVPVAAEGQPATLWAWDGEHYVQLPAAQDGPPTLNEAGGPIGEPIPFPDPAPRGTVVELVGVDHYG